MKVFVSSLITGMEPLRQAARNAIITMRHAPIMAEDFGASTNSPQVACLRGLRESDIVVLVLGARYGAEQASGLSATHEEYRAAKDVKPVLAFVEEGVTYEPRQAAFIEEVQGWESGLFRGGFKSPDDLRTLVTRGLHDYELATAVGPIDEAELLQRALGLLPKPGRSSSSSPVLSLVVSGAPMQPILRPIEIEDEALWNQLHKAALFGKTQIFDQARGVQKGVVDASLVIAQDREGPRVLLDEHGSVLVVMPVEPAPADRGMGMPIVIEETVQRQLATALNYAADVIDIVDKTQRLSRVAVAALITGGQHSAWRTQKEHEASPNSMSLGMGAPERSPVHLVRPRPALRLNANHIVEDLLVLLRRQWSPEGRSRSRTWL